MESDLQGLLLARGDGLSEVKGQLPNVDKAMLVTSGNIQ